MVEHGFRIPGTRIMVAGWARNRIFINTIPEKTAYSMDYLQQEGCIYLEMNSVNLPKTIKPITYEYTTFIYSISYSYSLFL